MGALKVWDGTSWQTLANQGKPGSNVFVGPSTPPGTPTSGDMWYDTDEVSGLTMPITLANGGTGGTTPAAARGSLAVPAVGNSAVTPGAPATGTWVRGDVWLDSSNVLWTCTVAGTPGTWVPPVGYELAYNQITASVTVTVNTPASPNLVIEGTSRSYDGGPIVVELYSSCVQASATAQTATIVNLWDGATDLGYIGEVFNGSATGVAGPMFVSRRIVPTAGTHNYRAVAFLSSGVGSGTFFAGPSNSTFSPAYIRVTRA